MTNLVNVEGLIELEQNDVIATFCDQAKLSGFVGIIKNAVATDSVDLTTTKGRKDIGSRAHKVSKVKTALTKVLDAELADTKALIKRAGEGKKFLTEALDELRDETRQPLTAWEDAEKLKEQQRIDAIQTKLNSMKSLGVIEPGSTKDEIGNLIEAIDNIDCSVGFDEFTQDALHIKQSTKETLSKALNDLIQAELAEAQRKEVEAEKAKLAIQERLSKLKMIPMDVFDKRSHEVRQKIEQLRNFPIQEHEFGVFYPEAVTSLTQVINQLETMATQKEALEKLEPVTPTQPIQEPEKIPAHPLHSDVSISVTPADSRETEIANWLEVNHEIDKALAENIAHSIAAGQVPFVTLTTEAAAA